MSMKRLQKNLILCNCGDNLGGYMREKYIKAFKFSLFYSISIEIVLIIFNALNDNFFIKNSIISFLLIFIILFLFKTLTTKIKG